MISIYRTFWKEQPALLLGLSLLVGTSSALFWAWPWNGIFPILWSAYLIGLRRFPAIALLIGGALYGAALYSGPLEREVGYFSIGSLEPYRSPFKKGLVYKGQLSMAGKTAPCQIYFLGEGHPKANCNYIVRGKLKQRGDYDYLFKAKEWAPVPKTWSFAELRYQMKEKLRGFLGEKLKRVRTASFLGSLLTGDVEDRSLRYEFGRLGLQHILAISGFHFVILVSFCSFFLGLFLPHNWKMGALFVIINGYFAFVGSVPAIQRGWLTAAFYLIGKRIGRHSTPLNLLGVSLLGAVMVDPLVGANLGFQLSFLSCWGILSFLPWLQSRPKRAVAELSPLSQHVHLLALFFRQALAVTMAVNAAILPLLLTYFHQFPLLSLLYNLFFPFLVNGALFALLLGLLVYFVFPPLGTAVFWSIDWFTAQLLDLAAYPPVALDYSLKMASFRPWMVPFYLFGLFCLTNSSSLGKILGLRGDRSSVG